MNDGYNKNYQYGSENKYKNMNKRPRQSDPDFYEPKHKKSKQDTIHFDNTSKVDILTLLKIKLQNILACNNKFINATIEDIQPYGSRVTGMYTDDSDVDFNINLTSKLSITNVIRSFVKSLRKSQVFITVVPIVHAKIPIIKCNHRDTGIDCDISFNNISAVHNSNFLNYFISMDHRIKPVLMELKAWAKRIGLICTNGFSSYSFYWLGLFSMQVMGILPNIHDLQKSKSDLLVGHWNFAFSKEQQFTIDQKKNLSVNDILNVIYEYYSGFDFKQFVISPYTGCPLLKKSFEDVEQLPEELWRYKKFYKENKEHQKLLFLGTSEYNMYIQDPFQHNLNITARVTSKMFEKFIEALNKPKS